MLEFNATSSLYFTDGERDCNSAESSAFESGLVPAILDALYVAGKITLQSICNMMSLVTGHSRRTTPPVWNHFVFLMFAAFLNAKRAQK